MVDDGQRASDELVLENGTIGDGDVVTLVGDDDDGTAELYVLANDDVAVDCQVVELTDVGDTAEALEEVVNLLEG